VRNVLGRVLFTWMMRSGRTHVWVGGGPGAGGREPQGPDVIDADFVDLDRERERNDDADRRGDGS